MRRRIYIDGIPAWSDNEPSYARAHGIRGSLVTGGPGPNDPVRKRAAERAKAADKKLDTRPVKTGRPRFSEEDAKLSGRGRRYATEEERIAARRKTWRESSQRRYKASAA